MHISLVYNRVSYSELQILPSYGHCPVPDCPDKRDMSVQYLVMMHDKLSGGPTPVGSNGRSGNNFTGYVHVSEGIIQSLNDRMVMCSGHLPSSD